MKWQAHRSFPGRFQADFPGAPMVSQGEEPVHGNTIQITEAVLDVPSEQVDLGFTVLYSDLGDEQGPRVVPVELFYDTMRGGVCEDFPDARLTAERAVRTGEFLGREFTLALPGGGLIRRVFLIGERMYFVTVAGSRLDQHRADIERFFGSFQILEA